ncbi:leucine-rich repeat flightless-interacting protein 2-like, partial [Clarias magur]
MSHLQTVAFELVQSEFEANKLLLLIQDSQGEAERRLEKAMEIIYEMEKRNNYPQPKVITLQEELSLSFRMCKELMREKEREQEAQRVLESQCKEMKETLKQRDEFLKVSLAEAERKHKEVSQLESEKSELMSEMNTLRGSVQHKEEELSLTQTKFQGMSMKLSEAGRKYDKAMAFLAKMEKERCAMMYHVNHLRGTVRELEEMLSDSERKHDALKQMSLAELTMENQALQATNAELRTEQTDLRADVNRLQALVHDLETGLTETTRKFNKMTLECEQKDQELKSMETRWDMMLK